MTRDEYNKSVGITKMFDCGDLSVEVDDEWKEFVRIILDSLPKIVNDREEEDI